MRALIADSDAQVRSALRLLLEHRCDASVVAETGCGDDFIALARAWKPDLIFLDWQLFGGNTSRLVRELRQACQTAFLIVMSTRFESRRTALDCGADAFVSKNDSPARITEAVSAFVPSCNPLA